MTPEFQRRVRQLFDEAMDQPVAQRSAFVETRARGERELATEVRRLLDAQKSSGTFLETEVIREDRIGRYVICGELGRGAMGVVYDAMDPVIERNVAVKVIRFRDTMRPGEAEFMTDRLFREAKSAGKLSHPGIVTIFDVGREGDSAFVTMERVQGKTLQELLEEGRKLDASEKLWILRQTAAALDYAHEFNVVHRDIKPGNIMLQKNLTVKVTDFGIAKQMSSEQATTTGVVMGTPSYMSPEQVEAATVDGRSDQFSLAVVAYELFTGVRPFEADTIPTLMHNIVYGARRPATEVNPELTVEMDQVLQRALSRKPADRFSNCGEFLAALEKALWHGKQLPKKRAPSSEGGKQIPRAAIYVLAGAALAVAVMAGVLFFLQPWRGPRVAAAPVSPKPVPEQVAKKTAAASTQLTPPAANSVPASSPPPIPPASRPSPLGPDVDGRGNAAGKSDDGSKKAAAKPGLEMADPDQLYREGMEKKREGQPRAAVLLFRESATGGNAEAMAELGESYRAGEGVDADSEEAAQWFTRSAQKGSPTGMVGLGAMYAMGEGVPESEADAVKWFQKATDRGNASGMYNLATMYESGQGTAKDSEKAEHLYRQAAALGNTAALRRLKELGLR